MLTVADTAYAIAVIREEEARLPEAERLFEDPYASLFRAAGAHAEEGTQRFLALPFLRDLVRIRTRFIDDLVRDALATDTRQLVLLGAGFDTRALRLPEIAAVGASVLEVDFAEQLAKKHALLGGAHVALPPWVRYVGCDFNAPRFDDELAADLAAHGFATGTGALFVWEGVIAYIGDAAIDRTLAFAARVGGAGSRIVFDFAEGRFEPESIDARTRRAGFARFEETDFGVLWRRYLGGHPHPNAAICRMGVAST
jgi:methyltransferase (TIGR00027 family)